jgi:sigma-B regulation protein RsbQ
MPAATVRNNVSVSGQPAGRPIIFLHGFGCDQTMWRHVAPAFEDDHRVVLLDHVGAGGSDLSAYRPDRYATLHGYADDLLGVVRELDLHDVVLVGHSVSAMIAVLAANREPERFGALVLVGPSPRYVDDGDYRGGFTVEDVEGLLETMELDYLGWSSTMAPVIVGNPDRPELGGELTEAFCRVDPAVARQFAQVTFLSDNRADLARVRVPTAVLQCTDDPIAPAQVGEYVHRHVAGSRLFALEATGHCPNLSAPAETTAAIRSFIAT